MNLKRICETASENTVNLDNNNGLENILISTLESYNYILDRNHKLQYIKTMLSVLRDCSDDIFENYSDEKKKSLEIIQENVLNEFENLKEIIAKHSNNIEGDLIKLSSLIHKAKNVVNHVGMLNENICRALYKHKNSIINNIDTFLLEFDFFDCNTFSFSDFLFNHKFSQLLFGENITIFGNGDDVKISNFSYFVYLLGEIRQNYDKYGENGSLTITYENNYLILNFTNEIREINKDETYSSGNGTLIIDELVSNLNGKVNKFGINKTGLFEVNISFKI